MPQPTIAAGQIYEDTDPRMGGRRLRVVDATEDRILLETARASNTSSVDTTGRKTRINRHRLAGSEFRLVKETA